MTKSYYYIPTHFLYSPLLFFLLIFMHQLTYCHTLSKPFSQIFLFRIYAPTIYSADFELDETSDRLPHISAPIQPPQTNPQRHRPPNLHVHTATQTNPPTTTSTNSTPAPTNAHRASAHKYTHCPADTHATQPRPPDDVDDALDADASDAVAAPTPSQHRCRHSLRWSAIRQARHQTGRVPDQTGSDWTRLNQSRLDQVRLGQTRPNQTSPGQAMPDFDPDETSRPVSANFSARPDGRLIRDAIRAVVDADAGTRLLPGCLLTGSMNQSQATCLRLDDCARLLAGLWSGQAGQRTESIDTHAVAHRLSGP